MATNNTINNKLPYLLVNPASGDSYITIDVDPPSPFSIGVDSAASDAFKIGQGNLVTTDTTLTITTDGIITKPGQAMFLNTINAEADVSGTGTVHDIGSVTATTSVINRASGMTAGDGAGTGATFTAPADGIYLLCFGLQIDIAATGGTTYTVQIVTTNRTFNVSWYPTENKVTNFYGLSNYLMNEGSVIEELAEGDTVVFRFTSSGGSADADDIVDGYLSGAMLI